MRYLFLFFFSCTFIIAQVPSGKGSRVMEVTGEEIPYTASSYATSSSVFKGENNKVGLKLNNEIVLEPIYDKIETKHNGFEVTQNGKKGFYSNKKEFILPVIFDTIVPKPNAFLVSKNKKWGSFDSEGKPVLKIKYPTIEFTDGKSGVSLIKNKTTSKLDIYFYSKKSAFSCDEVIIYSNNVLILKQNDKYGLLIDNELFLDFTQEKIITSLKAQSKYVTDFLLQYKYCHINFPLQYYYTLKDNKYSIYELKNEIISDLDRIINDDYFYTILFEKNKLQGAYFKSTKKMLQPVYQKIYQDGITFIELTKDNKRGLVNYNLDEILPFDYDDIYILGSNHGFKVTKNKKSGFFNTKGEMVIPIEYDDIENFMDNHDNLFKVKNNNLYGLITNTNEEIIPVKYESIFDRNKLILVVTPESKFGLHDINGTLILPAIYDYIFDTDSSNSGTLCAKKGDFFTIINKEKKILFQDEIKEHFYLHDSDLLKLPANVLALKNKKNKVGLFDEYSGKLIVPFQYDEILQYAAYGNQLIFLVKLNNKLGIIDQHNKVLIPLIYEDINLNFQEAFSTSLHLPAKKNGKYGIINNKNEIKTPFEYIDIQKISSQNLFKIKNKEGYHLANENGTYLQQIPFDNIANFEFNPEKNRHEAFAFKNGKMQIIQESGELLNNQTLMKMHDGFKTFDELKSALIDALNAKDDSEIITFSQKIAPSKHLLSYLNQNIFNKENLYLGDDLHYITERYTEVLLKFKHRSWNSEFYNKKSLTDVTDYTIYRDGIVTNRRATDWAYGDSKYMEKILRNAVKINGFWISTFFMSRSF